jgi:hypothetical protein
MTWKNMVEARRPQMTIWRVCIACGINKATASHLEYVTLMTFHCKNRYANAPQCCFYACISPLVLLSSLLGYIWPYLPVYDLIWRHLTYLTVFVHIWPYLTVFDLFDCIYIGCIWLYFTIYDLIWRYLTYITVFVRIWPYLTVFDLFDCIWLYLYWLCLTVFALAVFD